MDIFDEVAEDLRHDQAVSLAKRYGLWLLAGCIAVLIGVAAQQGWQGWQARQAQKAATAFLALTTPLDDAASPPSADDAAKAAKALAQFAASAPEGYKTLARLRAAALYAEAGQLAAAQALWSAVGQDSAADPLLRDAANLIWAQQSLGSAPNAEVQARLAPLALQSNPYHALARETLGLLYLHEGNTAQAKVLFTQITADPVSPENVRSRAAALLDSLNG